MVTKKRIVQALVPENMVIARNVRASKKGHLNN